MKFLGIRICDHDSNISYSIGNKVRYFKSERHLQIKHHGYKSSNDWISDVSHWNIDYDNLDGVCISADIQNREKILKDLKFIKCEKHFVDHHYAHVLSCWPIVDNTIIDFVFDGFGDEEKIHSLFKKDNLLEDIKNDYSSLGNILIELGKNINLQGMGLDMAGKLMALQSLGKNNEKYIDYAKNLDIKSLKEVWWPDKWNEITNNETHINYLKTAHYITEQIYLKYFKSKTYMNDKISYSGGIAQNIVINTILKNYFPNLSIPPHCADEGLSLGCIEYLRKMYNQPSFDKSNFPYWQDDVIEEIPTKKTIEVVADLLNKHKIVGWMQGRGEIGPRALGNRSILFRPDIKGGKDRINEIKKREQFRPFGCTVIDEYAPEYFDMVDDKYMLYTSKLKDITKFSAITHVDHTCRVQKLSFSDNLLFYDLIYQFYQKSKLPLLGNTSLNLNGKPICSTKDDALKLLNETNLDVLCVGNNIYYN